MRRAGNTFQDELLAINGTSVKDISLPDIKKMLRQMGEEVTLTVNRGGTKKTVSLTLQSLID